MEDSRRYQQKHVGHRLSVVQTIRRAMDEKLELIDLERIEAPMFVESGTGINDDLNGIERPVTFEKRGGQYEIVQSLAKWKRCALEKYEVSTGYGIFADMRAIRVDEILGPMHSMYVDQWDWERRIEDCDRNEETLVSEAKRIYGCLYELEELILNVCDLDRDEILPPKLTVVTTDELADRYPNRSPREREDLVCKEHGAVFLVGIGGPVGDEPAHDGRAPDYDDWSSPRKDGGRGLNGDILVWNPILQRGFELSSMGVRVNAEALRRQLTLRNKAPEQYHLKVLNGALPQSVGGGIGQSRLCMFLLQCMHIGEVQVSEWPKEMVQEYASRGIQFL